nr:MAG TPA: hypothetical protein [Caudoviricetes sp.]
MAKYCGGIALGEGLKLLNGVICDTNVKTVDVSKAVSTCGQLWDGNLFATTVVNGYKVITLHTVDDEDVGEPIVAKGNCGVGLDGRFFKLVKGKVNLQDGFILTVVTDPVTASVKVVDSDNVEIQPIEENGKTFLLSGIGDSYGVNVEKDGYTGKHITIVNNKDQTVNVELVENPQG